MTYYAKFRLFSCLEASSFFRTEAFLNIFNIFLCAPGSSGKKVFIFCIFFARSQCPRATCLSLRVVFGWHHDTRGWQLRVPFFAVVSWNLATDTDSEVLPITIRFVNGTTIADSGGIAELLWWRWISFFSVVFDEASDTDKLMQNSVRPPDNEPTKFPGSSGPKW